MMKLVQVAVSDVQETPGSSLVHLTVLGDPDEEPYTYVYEGRVSSQIRQGFDNSLSVNIFLSPVKSETAPPLSPPNAYKG